MAVKTLTSLWGSILESLQLDLVNQVVSMHIRVPVTPVEREHNIEIRDVSGLHFFNNAIPRPWSYVELTEIYVGSLPSAKLKIELVLWSENAGMVLEAGSMTLDGKRLRRKDFVE